MTKKKDKEEEDYKNEYKMTKNKAQRPTMRPWDKKRYR